MSMDGCLALILGAALFVVFIINWLRQVLPGL